MLTVSSLARNGPLLTFGAAACYGFNVAFARLASFEGISGTSLVAYRVALLLIAAGALALVARRSLAVPRGDWGRLALLGATSVVVGIAYLSSVTFIPVTVAVMIFYIYPALILLAGPFLGEGRLTPALLAVAGLAFTGVVLVIGPAFVGLDPRGLALAALAAVATAVQFYAAAATRRTSLLTKVFWIQVIVLPASLAIGALTGGLATPADLGRAPVAVLLATVGHTLGFCLQMAALTRTRPGLAGLIFCFEPVAAAVTAAFVLGESLTPVQAFGGALVLAAIGLSVSVEQRRTPVQGATP
ncbi:MAG TPA: DMT family transporter [Beijerinckiaceae bacterium]